MPHNGKILIGGAGIARLTLVQCQPDSGEVKLADGSHLHYDLVIGADGIHSAQAIPEGSLLARIPFGIPAAIRRLESYQVIKG